jgi:predicted HicB family RNase H-like nuclease
MNKKDIENADHAPVFDMKAAKAKFGAAVDNSRKARKTRLKAVAQATDGRSLRARGRTEQFNFKSTPGLKKRAQQAAAAQGISLAEWMENAVEVALGGGGADAE